jgi:hypothetical protein
MHLFHTHNSFPLSRELLLSSRNFSLLCKVFEQHSKCLLFRIYISHTPSAVLTVCLHLPAVLSHELVLPIVCEDINHDPIRERPVKGLGLALIWNSKVVPGEWPIGV